MTSLITYLITNCNKTNEALEEAKDAYEQADRLSEHVCRTIAVWQEIQEERNWIERLIYSRSDVAKMAELEESHTYWTEQVTETRLGLEDAQDKADAAVEALDQAREGECNGL